MATLGVLLVEDNALEQELALEAIAACGAFDQVSAVSDGAEALDWLSARGAHADRDAEQTPGLIIMDLKMSGVGGFDLIAKLRSEPKTALIPILVMSNSVNDGDVAECYRRGANGYVLKSMDFAEFKTVIDKIGQFWLTVNRVASPTAGAA